MRLIDADACWDRILNGCCYTTEYAIMGTPTIDPIHAAGGCYCKECVKANLLDDKNGYYCIKGITMPLNGFCSEGRKDEMKDEQN